MKYWFNSVVTQSLRFAATIIFQFSLSFASSASHIDMLILNAAAFALPHTRTVDNLETTFQVCHLAHHYIATRLSDRLDKRSRVVVVASESHRFGRLPADGAQLTEALLSPPANRYWAMSAYNEAKLCNVLFARELGRRWQDRGIAAYSLHPGNMVSSDLSRNWWVYRWLFALVRPFTKSLVSGIPALVVDIRFEMNLYSSKSSTQLNEPERFSNYFCLFSSHSNKRPARPSTVPRPPS